EVRHGGTIGGSLAHGDPASDLPAVLLALDAELVVHGPDGERTVPAREFFHGVFETALGPTDVLTKIRVPKLGPAGWSYLKFTRRAPGRAHARIAAVIRRAEGSIDEAAITLTNMGPTPVRAHTAEQALHSADDVGTAADMVAAESDPPSDPSGSSDYRRHLATVLARRALADAIAR